MPVSYLLPRHLQHCLQTGTGHWKNQSTHPPQKSLAGQNTATALALTSTYSHSLFPKKAGANFIQMEKLKVNKCMNGHLHCFLQKVPFPYRILWAASCSSSRTHILSRRKPQAQEMFAWNPTLSYLESSNPFRAGIVSTTCYSHSLKTINYILGLAT